MGLMSKLDCINQMLLASGESIITALTDTSVETGVAEQIFNQVVMDYQIRGLTNNQFQKKYIPSATALSASSITPSSGTGYIDLGYSYSDTPTDGSLISAELISPHYDTDGKLIYGFDRIASTFTGLGTIVTGDANKNLLYNTTNQTAEFSIGTEYTILMDLFVSFENIDTATQRAITATAERMYQMATQGDAGADKLLGGREQMFAAKAKASDINDRKRSIFTSGDNAIMRATRREFGRQRDVRYWQARG
tara:strand:+ start:31209 stop:31961 length:753 start_codon:yes stop_codon:yes gene_type:complete